jgi:hypothetical protein
VEEEVSRDKKTTHPANPLGVPVLPSVEPEEAPTPDCVSDLWGICRRPGLDVTAGFSTTDRWLSRIIRFITRGRVSHAWVAFHDVTLDVRMVLQAEWWGFELRPWARWTRENILVAEFQLLVPPEMQLRAIRRMRDHLGEKYDKVGALWAGISGWLKRWWNARLTLRPRRTPHKLMCAEAQLICLKASGIEVVADCYEETIDPETLLERLETSEQVLKVYPR